MYFHFLKLKQSDPALRRHMAQRNELSGFGYTGNTVSRAISLLVFLCIGFVDNKKITVVRVE